MIEREVQEFKEIVFEPHQGKVAIHTHSKKVLAKNQKQFSNDPNRMYVDIYQIKNDKELGFIVKNIGLLPSEKVQNVYFSCVGNIFSTVEVETGSRTSLNFFMISKISNEGQTVSAK